MNDQQIAQMRLECLKVVAGQNPPDTKLSNEQLMEKAEQLYNFLIKA